MARGRTRSAACSAASRAGAPAVTADGARAELYAALRRMHPFLTVERSRRAGGIVDAATLRLTARCNQRCPFCQAVPPGAEDDPPLAELLRAAARVAAALPGAAVVLTGGEPLLRSDLPDLLARLLALPGIGLVEVQTNAVLLGRQPERRSLPLSDRLRFLVGLHALRPEIYDACTATRGELADALAGIRALRAAGAAVELNCVVSSLNLAHIPEMPELLAERLGPAPPPLHFSVLGMPEQRDVRDLLVRYGEMLDAVDEAAQRAEAAGVVVELALSASHAVVPPCIVERRPRPPLDLPVGYEHEGDAAERRRWWRRGKACRACARRAACFGLPRAYAERFGFAEVAPLG